MAGSLRVLNGGLCLFHQRTDIFILLKKDSLLVICRRSKIVPLRELCLYNLRTQIVDEFGIFGHVSIGIKLNYLVPECQDTHDGQGDYQGNLDKKATIDPLADFESR
nr:hypothetical protein [uncultured Cohaesibacter sp.]